MPGPTGRTRAFTTTFLNRRYLHMQPLKLAALAAMASIFAAPVTLAQSPAAAAKAPAFKAHVLNRS